MKLDLSSLKKAVSSLNSALEMAEVLIQGKNDKQDDLVRAGVIQNFEFTYELCWKFMKRWLEVNYNPDIDGLTRKELFRIAFENKLIKDVEIWLSYNDARNKTSHTYDNEKASNVFEVSKEFITDAKDLLATLESKND
ncbi:MAG: nucleotidyltransferase substrate binding protein [Endomicrobia bacterium]|nr:nucleotidyltransferase substrate binding protein [Endomicrobiia bacterium]MCL2507255.1 nucleotidyltransferase substrate binding protein [Endomicrobiia bacterium]